YSSNKLTSNRAIRVLACPRKPNNKILCRERIAVCKSGITVSSKPIIPSNPPSPFCSWETRFSLNSSLTDRLRYPVNFNWARVFIFVLVISHWPLSHWNFQASQTRIFSFAHLHISTFAHHLTVFLRFRI